MIFSTHSVTVMCHVYWFAYVRPPLHLGEESHPIEVDDHFDALQNPIGGDFAGRIHAHQGRWPAVSSPRAVLLNDRILYRGDAGLIKMSSTVPFSSIFWEHFEEDWHILP